MKKAVLAALVAAASFQAVGSEYVSDGWYIGLDVIDTELSAKNWTEGAVSSNSVSDVSSTSLAAAVGYDFNLVEYLYLGVELEYAYYGSFDVVLDGSIQYPVQKLEFTALNLNLKPKYYIADTAVYLGGIFGIGFVNGNNDSMNSGTYGSSASGDSVIMGAELGYNFTKELSVNLGYRTTTAKFDNVDFDMKTIFAGLDYKF
ncbi:outer membrane protein [Vibrio hepatarius]|uniref:outer membrane protein n=1 Tax=Vibrio hepatarius TaxID=171383 RepID=UPI001C097ED8|nr:outer membrane beta-barrel protein [Vibrio hepatarius]MBU2898556.1 porin family protein [Vibrio hepatarius]